jgi:isopropylmalate/homocitrate/citramalate synthase
MLRFNHHTHTLEQADYQYDLHDAKAPNLFRDIYSYGEVPKIAFNQRLVPMCPPAQIFITDTTFRDGQQARPPYTVKQIVDIFDLIHKLGGPKGIIRQCEFFLYTDKDREAVEKCRERGYRYPEVTGWIRAVKGDFQLVKQMGLKETGILTSASDYHIFLKLNKTRKQALEMYLDIARAALDNGIIPRCHFEDITRADFYGFVVPFAQELMRLAEQYRMPVKIRACDTLGYGVPYPGASLPRSVPGIMYGLSHYAGVPSDWLEWHGHNDFYKVLINASSAWLYGCGAANGTLLGLGERTGNTPVEGLVMEYIMLRGDPDGMETTVITEIANYYRKEVGYEIPPMTPLVGADFNITRAGIHIDGLLKSEEIYNIFDTKKILHRPLSIAITDKSGLAGIAYWVDQYLGLEGDQRIPKNHPALQKIKEWVDKEYETGRASAISNEEMLALVQKHLPQYFAEEKAQKQAVLAGAR